jgi:cytoskeletal protein CcmA (bactofilin family)
VSLQLGGQSFCVQFWVFLTSSPASNPIIFGKDQNTITAPIEYYGTITTGGINFSTTSGYNVAGSFAFTPQINTWYHVAWTSDGTNYRVFVNGQMGTPVPVSSAPITNSTGPLYVGASARQTNYFTGYIEDFRIDRGVANYTSSFPVPVNYLGTGPNTVFYLRSWTAGSGIATALDQTVASTGAIGYYNIRMVSTNSPATITTVGPYNATTSGQALYFDGSYNWYSTGGFRVRGTLPALSVNSGALQVAGGAGIVGNLYAGNILTTGVLSGSSVTATSVVSSIVSADLHTYANGINILNGVAGTYGNANVAAYLPIYTGDLKGTIVSASLYTYANGVNILNGIGGTYTNANVTSYLPIHSGPISASAYFYANGTPFNYGNVQVSAYLPTHTGNVNGAYLFGNLVSIGTSTLVGNISTVGSGGNITGANVISANTYTYANGLNILTGVGGIYSNANVIALLAADTPTTVGGNLTVTGNLIVVGNSYVLQTEILTQNEVISGNIYAANYFYSNGLPFTTSTYSNSNVSAFLSTYTGTLSNSSDIVALYANAAVQASAISGLTANVNSGQANAAVQAVAISSLATGANANTAAYLTTATGAISASTIDTSGNVVVGGNLIVVGNSYVLQTEILTQNEVITGNVYASGYYFANGFPFVTSSYSNANVASFLTMYSGTLSAGNVYSGGYFYANGTPLNYGNVQAQAYFSTYSGNVSAGAYFYANGTPFNYGNVQVGAYLLTNTGNIASNHFIGNIRADVITSIRGNVVIQPVGSGVAVINTTTALQLPKGTTDQRPPGGPGYLRFNTEGNSIEFFDGGAWVAAVNSITQQTITGDNVTKTFTLNQLTTSVGILVSINGTVQQPDVAYTVSGTQITFAEAPNSTDVIDVRFIVSASATIVDTIVVDSGKVQIDTTPATLDSWPIANYRSAKYTVSSSTGTQSQISDVWITHDGSSSFISNTTLQTGADTLHFTTSVIVGNVVLRAYSTTTNNQVRIQRTYFEI